MSEELGGIHLVGQSISHGAGDICEAPALVSSWPLKWSGRWYAKGSCLWEKHEDLVRLFMVLSYAHQLCLVSFLLHGGDNNLLLLPSNGVTPNVSSKGL